MYKGMMIILKLAVALSLLWFTEESSFDYCGALTTLGSGVRPIYLAVISQRPGADVAWTSTLPMHHIFYSYGTDSSPYSLHVEKGAPSSAFIKFIIDHFDCLPRWTLFLPNQKGFHPLDPSVSSALIDVSKLDRGFLALGHVSSSTSNLLGHPASSSFSAMAPPHSHKVTRMYLPHLQFFLSKQCLH
jgi:hypothetical protein